MTAVEMHMKVRHMAVTGTYVRILFEDQHAVQLERKEVTRLLDEIADATPELLYIALENRFFRRVEQAIQELRQERETE